MTVAAYVRQLLSLLPRGKLFEEIGPVFTGTLEAVAEELQRVEDHALGALAETRPLTAFYSLAEWEAKYDLPSDGSTTERRARIAARRAARRRTRPADYKQRLSSVLGLDPLAVAVIETSPASAVAMGDAKETYRFFVFRDPALPGTYSVVDAQALLDDFVQSHAKGHIIESTNFLCDDPYSLCDRDLLELPGFSAGYLMVGASEGFLTVDEVTGFLEVS